MCDLLDKRVAVIAGGWSDEREISLLSGRACQKALTEAGFREVQLLDVADSDFIQQLTNAQIDVAFVAMHGLYGEDGSIQGLLEILHIPYTFSHVLASAVGTAKELAKVLYRQANIPTPKGKDFAAGTQLNPEQIQELVSELRFPMFVKPSENGSSFGVTKVEQEEQLQAALDKASVGASRVLVETCVEGTEITVPVLGNHDAQALPIIEIHTGAEFYDQKVKYEAAELHHIIPARLSEEVYARAQELAVRAHQALGCAGASRSDFIVSAEGTPYILETNTIPGMTEASLYPDAARHAGISFPELCKRFVQLALEAHSQK